jgi:hypothetical protein
VGFIHEKKPMVENLVRLSLLANVDHGAFTGCNIEHLKYRPNGSENYGIAESIKACPPSITNFLCAEFSMKN